MPLFHCKNCHHEWPSTFKNSCDWCGGDSYILEEVTSFEEFINFLSENLEEIFTMNSGQITQEKIKKAPSVNGDRKNTSFCRYTGDKNR